MKQQSALEGHWREGGPKNTGISARGPANKDDDDDDDDDATTIIIKAQSNSYGNSTPHHTAYVLLGILVGRGRK